MVGFVSIAFGILLNVLCIWMISIMCKDGKSRCRFGWQEFVLSTLAGGAVSFFCEPYSLQNSILFSLFGAGISELLLLFHCFSVQQGYNEKQLSVYYDDGAPPKFYITGDKHRNFEQVKRFCHEANTRRKDVLIVLGDAGFNYYDDIRDDKLKTEMSALNITLFCLHGNKEKRPQNIETYGVRSFCGGKVYYEPKYPNIYFAIDGEVYTFDGRKYMVVGGAHSVDKQKCLEESLPYWDDEMPNEEIKRLVEARLALEGDQVYGMLTHTCPIDYLPTEMFVSTRQNAEFKRNRRKRVGKKTFVPDIDRSTEVWLGDLEKRIQYAEWFCGHYHIDKQLDKICIIYQEIRPLRVYENCEQGKERDL